MSIDLIHSNYRMAFFWTTVLTIMAIVPLLRVMRARRTHGGPAHYVAPLPTLN